MTIADDRYRYYEDLTDEALIALRALRVEEQAVAGEVVWMIERILQARMEDDGASARVVGDSTLTIETGTIWDREALRPMLEYEEIPVDALAGAYTPAHTETVAVPEAWNMTKAKALAKYGERPRRVLEAAAIPGDSRLKITKGV
jgi:hypothetical protein